MRYFFIVLMLAQLLHVFAQDTISVVLSPQSSGYSIPADFAGLSYEKNQLNKGTFAPSKDTLLQLFQTLQIQSVRMGGNSVDKDTFGTVADSKHFTTAELDSFYLFIQKAKCNVLAGLNFGGDFNPLLAGKEVQYIMSKYAANVRGFEIGNEPDLYHSNGFRPANFNVAQYDSEYILYTDTILFYTPNAIFTGPVAATNYTTFTLPFCRNMHGRFAMLTQHYYVAGANTLNNHNQIINLLNPVHRTSLLTAVNELVKCADSADVPFRMAECNSLYNGGQWGVSDAFASTLWALDYMYGLASVRCAGVNFHGALGGAYSPLAYANGIYSVRPIGYGLMAFNVGSKGCKFIPNTVTNNQINLTVYSTIDSLNNTYTTIINKDTLTDAVIQLNGGDNLYNNASYITLAGASLADTASVMLGGQRVDPDGTCQSYTWQTLLVAFSQTQLLVPAGSAAIVKFGIQSTSHITSQNTSNNNFTLFPNPATVEIFISNSEPLKSARIEIFDVLGKMIFNQPVDGQLTPINVTMLSHGIYCVKVLDEEIEVFANRFVKE